jgi:hypothetical protein
MVLGVAVQLCILPWLGFVPDDVAAAPPVAVTGWPASSGESEGVLAGGAGPVHLDDAGDLIIPPLSAEDIPTEVRDSGVY